MPNHYDSCREGYCAVCGQVEGYCEHTEDKPTHPDFPPEEYLRWKQEQWQICIYCCRAGGVDTWMRILVDEEEKTVEWNWLSNREVGADMADACRRWLEQYKVDMHIERYPDRKYHPAEGFVASCFEPEFKHIRMLKYEWEEWGDENG